MEALAKFFEFLKIPIKYTVGAFIVSAAFIFAPDSFLNSLGVLKYREEGKRYFGILLLIVSVLIIGAIVGAIINKFNKYFFLRARQKRLNLLTAEEMEILRGYIESETRTLYLDIQSGVVKGLVHEDIIYRSSNVNAPSFGHLCFAHNIQPWAWEYLHEHRDLLISRQRE